MNKLKLSNIKPLEKVFKTKCIPITFSSSNYFAPYLGVTIKSLINNCDKNYNYDFIIFTKDMDEFNKKTLSNICKGENFSIRFVNLSKIFNELKLYTPGHVTIETYFRLVIPEYMKNYKKILFLDSDLLLKEDIKELYEYDLSNYALAACEECLMSALVGIHGDKAKKYMIEKLHLKNIDKYFQAGVMLLNIEQFKKNNYCEILLNMVNTFDYNIVDQDAMNELLNDKILWLPNEWNYPPLQKHMKEFKYLENMSKYIRRKYLAVKRPKIIHFADRGKPWFDPTEDYATDWWEIAKTTTYYEEILKRMCENAVNPKIEATNHHFSTALNDLEHWNKNVLSYWKYKLLRNITFGKSKEKIIEKKYAYKQKIWNAKNYKK